MEHTMDVNGWSEGHVAVVDLGFRV
jgi:hypothetical protein